MAREVSFKNSQSKHILNLNVEQLYMHELYHIKDVYEEKKKRHNSLFVLSLTPLKMYSKSLKT